MIEYKLNIGDVVTSSADASYRCFGLGSCVGLFIQDRLTGLSGGAHIFLPEEQTAPVGYPALCSSTYAIEELLKQMKMHGSSLLNLRAKVTGGANLFGVSYSIGERNSQSVIRELINKKIFVAGHDLGGTHCRTVKFESNSGLLFVSKPQINQHEVY